MVCEDEGAAFVFFERILLSYRKGGSWRIASACGNKQLVNTVKSIRNLCSGDNLLLVVDRNGQDMLSEIFETITDYCGKSGCKVYITTHFCVEELILAYTYVETLGGCNNEYWLSLLELVRGYVNVASGQKGGYYMLPEFQEFIKANKSNGREHAAFQLLNFILQQSRDRFRFEKGNIGKCWITDCYCTAAVEHPHWCDRCPWHRAGMTALTKREHFEANNLLGLKVERISTFERQD